MIDTPPCNNVHGRRVPPRLHVGPRGAAYPCTTPEEVTHGHDGLPFTILRDVVQQRTKVLPREEQRTGLLPVGCPRRTQLHTRAGPAGGPLHGVGVLLGEVRKACLDERHLEPANGHATMEDA